MKRFFSCYPLICISFLTLPADPSRAQTIADALDTPGLSWTPLGPVTPLNSPALSHDGVDVLRIDATPNSPTSGPWPSVMISPAVPSVVEFWHRSQDLEAVTSLGRNELPTVVSSIWRKERWVQFPAIPNYTSGELIIGNRGSKGSGPLFLDELSIRPAATTSFAVALDYPGFVGSSTSARGMTESWLSPDGMDAVVFVNQFSSLDATLPGPGLISFRSSSGGASPGVNVTATGAVLPAFTHGDKTWTWIAAAGLHRFEAGGGVARGTFYNQAPTVLDTLERPEAVTLEDALDAPGLTFSLAGVASGAPAPPGAFDGDAMLCLHQYGATTPESNITLTVSGPGIVQFSFLGRVEVTRAGQTGSNNYSSLVWQTRQIPVYRSGETITWKTTGSVFNEAGFWLNAVNVVPPSPETSIAGLLNAPDLVPEILVPAYLEQKVGQDSGDEALQVTPITPIPLQSVLRLPFDGPALVSLRMSDVAKAALVRIDGGGWQTPNYLSGAPFRAIVPAGGPHTLEVTGPVVLDRFEVIPLTSVPLAEALDAPGLTFTTSPDLPWSGYSVPAGMGLIGSHGAFGGNHSTDGDPWIETQVTGPGILRSSANAVAAGGTPALTVSLYPKLLIDGVLADPDVVPGEVLLSSGLHTVRWVQKGSKAQGGSGTLAFLDAVSYEPISPLSYGEALDTANRVWTVGGAGEVVPVAWTTKSPDGVDSVQFQTNPALNPSYLETIVNLPCRVSIRGKNIQVSTGNTNHFQLLSVTGSASNPHGFSFFRDVVSGNGPAKVRFTATSTNSVLDAVDFELTGPELLPTINLGVPSLTWSLYGGKAWRVVPSEATGIDRYRTTTNAELWMETIINGPGKLDILNARISLPEHDNRLTDSGWIPYSGPQRVLVSLAANIFPHNITFRSTPAIAAWNTSPTLTWTTGGDVPWQSGFGQGARSGRVWPGEVSWIEAAVTGPGVLFYDSTKSGTNVFSYFTCDSIALPNGVARGWLHLGNGEHRIRWEMANPRNGLIDSTGILVLNNVVFAPQPVDSVSAVLSAGSLNFYEIPPISNPPEVTAPVTWPAPSGWQVVSAPDLPGTALRGNYSSGSLSAFLPASGRIATLLKMEGATYPGAAFSSISPASAAPFPWLPWTSTSTFPRGDGFQTFVAQCGFTPDSAVTVAEALDQIDLTWTSGSNPPGLWQPLTTPYSAMTDKDALHLVRAAMGDFAWLETTVTGPVRVTTNFDGIGDISATGIRILMGDVLAVPDTFFPTDAIALQVPAGSHRLRWEIAPVQPIPSASGIAIRSITTSAATTPDVPLLLDAPGLEWAATGSTSMTTLTTGTHDGADALGLAGNRFVASLLGPGNLSFWMKAGNPSNGLALNSIPVTVTTGSSSTWFQYFLPIPQGRHTVTISGNQNTALDEFLFQALPALSAETALDATAGVTISVPDPEKIGAAAYNGFTSDGTDSLILLPGQQRRLAINVPPLSSITMRARAVFLSPAGSPGLRFREPTTFPLTTAWTTVSFSTVHDSGMSVIYLQAINVPIMLDRLMVSTPPPLSEYFAWAAAAGLSVSQQSTTSDPDGDGISNFSEYASGLDPTVSDAILTGTATVPGLPEASVFTTANGQQFLEVRYWRRSVLAASLETASQTASTALLGESTGWTTSTNPVISTIQPGGWVYIVWRSPTPIAPGTRQFARVRNYLP